MLKTQTSTSVSPKARESLLVSTQFSDASKVVCNKHTHKEQFIFCKLCQKCP